MLKASSGSSDPAAAAVDLFLTLLLFFFLGGISLFLGDSACLPSTHTEVRDREIYLFFLLAVSLLVIVGFPRSKVLFFACG